MSERKIQTPSLKPDVWKYFGFYEVEGGKELDKSHTISDDSKSYMVKYYLLLLFSFRNHSNLLIWCSRNISYYYNVTKMLCCLICLVTMMHFSGFFNA